MKVRIKFLITILIFLICGVNVYAYTQEDINNLPNPETYNSCCYMEIIVTSSLNDFVLTAIADDGYSNMTYDRNIRNEECCIKLASFVDVGESIVVDVFGTLNKNGTETLWDGRIMYIYEAPITDNTIFDRDIEGQIISEEYNMIFYYEIHFEDVGTTDINDLEINVSIDNKEYTGEEIKTSINIKDGEYTLIEDTDYLVIYYENYNVGTATVSISGKGYYSGTIERQFKIEKASLEKVANVIIDEENIQYTGHNIEPSLIVKNGEKTLIKGKDYTVEYKDNTNIGTATVTIIGIGNYAGSINKTFKIISENTDYKYTILNDGTIEINEYIGYDKEIVEIPNKIDGYKVTKIGDNAFINEYLNSSETEIISNNRQHIKIIIPEGVISIGKDTFKACDKLVEVDLPDTVLSIGTNAFQSCTSLKEIIIPDSTTLIGIGAFRGNSSLERIVLSKNITEINDSTFAYCTNLIEIIIPEKVQTINEMAFYQCTSIEKMVIPKSVIKIAWEAFGNCTALEEIEFNETTIIEIEMGAFYDCPNLTKVVLPKTITEIKDNANTQYNTIFEGASSELIIYVENGSYAQQFCIDNNYNYHIEVRELKDLYVDIDVENKEFTGDAIETDIIITDGELILIEDIDYIVEYTENINVGTATLIINGIGNYAGTITKNFEIEAKDIATLTDIVINPCYEAYTGYPIYVSEGIKDGENELSNGWDYVIEYEDNINPGTATAIIKGQNNYKGEILRTYEIAKRDISNLIINVNTDDYIYTGEAIEPPVEIIYDGRVLKLNEDYEVSYENNINVGTATVTITGIGYYKGTVEKKFEIYKKSEFVYWKVCSRDYRYDYPYEYGLYEYLSKNNIDVSQVSEIIFNNIKKTENVINSNISLDVSKNSDKSVMVYVLENKLYIQYEGILKLDNAIGLFTGFKNVTHIKGLEHIDTSKVTSMWCMFNGCESLLEIDVSSFDTSNVTNMQSMFCDCFKIKKIDLSNFNTEHVQSMGFMFENDYWLEELNLNGFKTRAVTNMCSMFYNCIWLRRVDLTSFDTRNVTSMDRMFYKSGLEELDLSSFDTSKVTDMSDMFWYASSLTKIYVSKMWNVEGVRDSSSMFGGNTKLSGNNGTKYDSSVERDKTYARIDSYYTPGYLSAKIDIKSDMYNLEKDYIYISNQQFDLSKIETTNCTKVMEDNILYINYEDILIRKYYIINILSEHYDIGEDNIVVFEEEVDLDKINIINASKEILNDILYIKFQDEVVKEYKINMPYEGFALDNTVTYNGQAYGIKLKESNPYNIKVKYADKNGNYTLTEMPKYSNAGTYKINYMLYVDNNNGTVKGYKTLTIKKADIKYTANNKTVTYNGNGFGIDLNIENPKNVLIKYADKNGNYTLTEMPKYSNVGVYKIKYKIYINDNYNEIKNENILTINKANIKNNSTNYEGMYDGKEHSINVKVDIPNYDIKYSVNNNEYNLNTLPSFKEVGDYTINYKITSPNYNDLIGSNKVRIYGVKQLDSTLEIRNNMLIVKNYKNNFTDLCNRIQLHANSKSYLHLNQNKNVINDLLVRTGEYIQLLINNSSTLEYKVSILADVNGDGKISALDYVKIKNHIMKTNLINTDVYLIAADVNDDGKISALDYVRIKNYIMNGGV